MNSPNTFTRLALFAPTPRPRFQDPCLIARWQASITPDVLSAPRRKSHGDGKGAPRGTRMPMPRSVQRVGEVATTDDDLGIGGIEEFEQLDQPRPYRGALISRCAAHQCDQALEGRAYILVEDLDVGGGECGRNVAGRGIGNRDGVRALCGCAGQEFNLPNRRLRFDAARIGIQDRLVRLLCRDEVAGLELLAGLRHLGIDWRGNLRNAFPPWPFLPPPKPESQAIA